MFVGLIQRAIGQREASLSLAPGATLRTLVQELASRYGQEVQERLVDEGVLAPHATVLINGQNALHHGGLDAPLGDAATTRVEIVLLGPPVMGG
jgi:molybdopterin converting factor small subunit